MSDPRWWKKTLKSIRPQDDGQMDELDEGMNESLLKQGCHPFYAALIEGGFIDKVINGEDFNILFKNCMCPSGRIRA